MAALIIGLTINSKDLGVRLPQVEVLKIPTQPHNDY